MNKKSILFFIFCASLVTTSLLPVFAKKRTGGIEQKIEEMDLREKVAQMFVVRLESLDPAFNTDDVHKLSAKGLTEMNGRIEDTFRDYPAGGVILFGRNIESPRQTKKLTKKIHNLESKSDLRPLIFIDEEGGIVSRLANNKAFDLPKFESMKKIGESGDEESAWKAGKTIGKYLREFGFDVDFAPVADVDTNPENPIIGDRAFSTNPEQAAKMSAAFEDGLESEGARGCMKHFPGHGDTQTDTHQGYAETEKTWEELLECEMLPFKEGIRRKVPFIMTAHISAPKIDESGSPSTLSKTITTEKLRKELGYDGIIITDAMEMSAITKNYKSDEAVIKSILAGSDMILIPYDYRATFESVLEAVKTGVIPEERINESVRRILKVKFN